MAEESETVGEELRFDGSDFAASSNVAVGDISVVRKLDAENVAEAFDVEGLKTAEMIEEWRPGVGTIQECWNNSCVENFDFGL